MEVPGLCQVCQKPGVLVTCALCGALAHAQCLRSGAHVHLGRFAPGDEGGDVGGPPRT